MEWIGFFSNLRLLVISYPIEIFILIGVLLLVARKFSGDHVKRLRRDIKHRTTLLDEANKKGRALVQRLENTHQKSKKVYQLLQQSDGNLSAERQSNQEILDELEDAQAEVKQAYRLLNQAEDNLAAEREARLAEERKNAVLFSVIQQLGGQGDFDSHGVLDDYEALEADYVMDELPAGLQMSQENFTQKFQAFLQAEEGRSSKSTETRNAVFDDNGLPMYDMKQKRKPNDGMYFIADDMWSGSNGDES